MAHSETALKDILAAPRCLECPAPATHGLVRTKRGRYRVMRVPNGARWCKAHSFAAAKQRNTAARRREE